MTTPPNFKVKAPKLEDLSVDKLYSITINPKGNVDEWTEVAIYKFYRHTYDELQKFKGVEFVLHLESSPIGRLHYHGIMSIKSLIDYVKFISWFSSNCAGEIDEISDLNKWTDYIFKQSSIWKPFLKSHVLGYPMYINRTTSGA